MSQRHHPWPPASSVPGLQGSRFFTLSRIRKRFTTGSDRPGAALAESHILYQGYARAGDTPAVSRVASTVAFVREGDVRVMIDPGMLPDPAALLASLRALGESPTTITDVIF